MRARGVWVGVILIGLVGMWGCRPREADRTATAVGGPTADSEVIDGLEASQSMAVAEPKSTNDAEAEAEAEPASSIGGTEASAEVDDPGVIAGPFDAIDWNSRVGDTVTIGGDLVVVDTYDLVRRGQVRVGRQRLFIPTATIDPNDKNPAETSFTGGNNVAEVVARQKLNDASTIILDDGSDDQNLFPPPLVPGLGERLPTLRIGTRIGPVTGVVTRRRNNVVIDVSEPLQIQSSERPDPPRFENADMTVASFNVLNFFTTIDNGDNRARGADSSDELTRQQDKIVAAMIALDADVFGLMELENNLDAENRLIDSLNEAVGDQVFRGCGLPDGFGDLPGGGDAIRCGIIYRGDRVKAVGPVTAVRDNAFWSARAPIVQVFRSIDGGDELTVIVNHFKSKGGASDADAKNKNRGDGQGAYNAARTGQSQAILRFVDQMDAPEKRRVLVIGDLNAYQQEDPIDALRDGGMIDLHPVDPPHYSFVYYGQSGSLDHALATPELAEDVVGIATWHINADEPRWIDYNTEYRPDSLYQADPYRSSDHDPVLIGIKNR